MNAKTYLAGGLAVAVFIAAVAWYRGQIREAELRGQLNEISADLEAAIRVRDSVEAELGPLVDRLAAERDSLALRQDSLKADLKVATNSANRWRQRYDHVRNDSAATIADIMEAADSAVATATEEAKSCSLALQNCTSITANLESQVEAVGLELTAEQRVTEQQARKIAALEAMQPKTPILPWAIAGGATVVALAALIFN